MRRIPVQRDAGIRVKRCKLFETGSGLRRSGRLAECAVLHICASSRQEPSNAAQKSKSNQAVPASNASPSPSSSSPGTGHSHAPPSDLAASSRHVNKSKRSSSAVKQVVNSQNPDKTTRTKSVDGGTQVRDTVQIAKKRRKKKPKLKPAAAAEESGSPSGTAATTQAAAPIPAAPTPAPRRTTTIQLSTSSLLSSDSPSPHPSSTRPRAPPPSSSPSSTRAAANADPDGDDDEDGPDLVGLPYPEPAMMRGPPGGPSGVGPSGGNPSGVNPSGVGPSGVGGMRPQGSVDWSAVDVRVANLAPKRKSLHQRFAIRACSPECEGSGQLRGWCHFEVKINFSNLVHMYEVLPDLLSCSRVGDGVLALTLPGEYLVHIVESEAALEPALQQLGALMMDPLLALDVHWCREPQADGHRHPPLALLVLSTPRRCVLVRMSAFKQRGSLPESLRRLLTSPDVRLVTHDWTHEHELRAQAQFGIGQSDLPGLLLLRDIAGWFGYGSDASVRDLLHWVLGVDVSKKVAKRLAATNWEAPALSAAQVKNAALDALAVGAILRQLRFLHAMRFRCPWCMQGLGRPATSSRRETYRCRHPGCQCRFDSFDEYDSHCSSMAHAATHVRTTCYWCGRSVVLLRDDVWQVTPIQGLEPAAAPAADLQQQQGQGQQPQQQPQLKRTSMLFSGLMQDLSAAAAGAGTAGSDGGAGGVSAAGAAAGRVAGPITGVRVRLASSLLSTEEQVVGLGLPGGGSGGDKAGKKKVVARSSLLPEDEPGVAEGDGAAGGGGRREQGGVKEASKVKARVSLLSD